VGLLSWIVLGLIAGWIAGRITNRPASGCVTRVAVGVVGALVGGALARAAGYEGVDRFGLRSILLAALGATVFLLVLSALEGRRGGRRRLF
jgi:uncharacterized membrane protein YeaQ/YmgE (transglycosylase-associated protein family)